MLLEKKKIMLCVTGSIAAYKAAYICSRLVKAGAEVFPVLTPNALNFINPLTLSTISGKKTLFEEFNNEEKIYHISLSHSVDAILIAPATANTVSKLACGICDNFLTTAVISSVCPVLIAPAMNETMYLNHAVQENIKNLKASGQYFFVEPESGRLACGEEGVGRLANEDVIIGRLSELMSYKSDLKGKKIIITAGATIEQIDSVRYISNLSSGKMGIALAEEAYSRGAGRVVLVSASDKIQKPYGVDLVKVGNTQEMLDAILNFFNDSDITVMAAAVSDIVPDSKFDYKLKKNDDIISKLKFKENINILQKLSEIKKDGQFLAGFAAESGENIDNAREKISSKNLDMIVLNDISRKDFGMGSDYNEVIIILKDGNIKKIPRNTKRIIARGIWDEIIKNHGKNQEDINE
jgi:phosphopantothenoylcysteine decarboxylase / phosphopantothenate---cysteine ligase